MCKDQTSNDLLLIFFNVQAKCYQNAHTHSIYITKKLQHKYMIIKLTNNVIA